MTGNTLTNVSEPVHDHDAADKLYVDRCSGGTDKVSRSGDSLQGDLDMGGYSIAGLNTSLQPRHTDAVCWSRAVELTREEGSSKISETNRARMLKLKTQLDVVKYSLCVQKFLR